MTKVAIYPGSFDPPTLGHLNIIERGLQVFDKVIIAVAVNTTKKSLFSLEERKELLKSLFKNHDKIEVDSFEGLMVDYAKARGTGLILRGVRTVADFEYELQMSFANKKLWKEIESVFIMTESHYSHISSSIIKEIAQFGGTISEMVPEIVETEIKKKY